MNIKKIGFIKVLSEELDLKDTRNMFGEKHKQLLIFLGHIWSLMTKCSDTYEADSTGKAQYKPQKRTNNCQRQHRLWFILTVF